MAFRDHNQSAFCEIVGFSSNISPKVPAVAIGRSNVACDLVQCTKRGSKTVRTTSKRHLKVERGPEA